MLEEVITHYEHDSNLAPAADSGVFHGMFEQIVEDAADNHPHQRIADVAFVARWELVRKLDALGAAERLERWDLIAACGSALRRVVKAISGVERVLAEVEGRPSMFTALFKTKSQEAVLTRQAYIDLIAHLHDIQAQRMRLSVSRCVRLAGIALATLIGKDIYEALRIEDRRTLRDLQQRVITWLRGGQDQLEGDRLLGDACALGSLLMQVNRRPELIEHDRQLLERLLLELEQPSGVELELSALRGRDVELDALLDNSAALEHWREPVARMLVQLRSW